MRIRRYASSIASQAPPPPPPPPPSAPPQVVCELNLSPWDITPFTPQSEFDFQLKIEDDYTLYHPWSNVGEECLDTTSQRYKEEEDAKSLVAKKKTQAKKRKDENYVRCVKTDGKTWQCKKQAQRGETLCQHHLVQLQAYYNKYYHSTKKPNKSTGGKARAGTATATTVVANKKRNRGRVQTKPADFYYYSGFGPSWGKKRGGGDEITEKQLQVVEGNVEASSPSSPPLCTNQQQAASSPVVHVACDHDDVSVLCEFEDDDDDDDDEEGNVGKKRIRKRVKARSLKSLF